MSHKGEGQVSTVRVNMGVTTKSLIVDDVNPTGLPQVFEESVNGVVQRTYTYGLQRISEDQIINNSWTPSFYGYDGFGSVRQLTGLDEKVTDNYNYDAFGNLLSSPGPTPNNYLYRGEQFDSDMGLYYLRARYYNPQTGRFLSRDPFDGDPADPKTLHKYLYAGGDPVNAMDPTGRLTFEEGLLVGKIIGRTIGTVAFLGCVVDAIYEGIGTVVEYASKHYPGVKKFPAPPPLLHYGCIATAAYYGVLWLSGLFFGVGG